MFRALGALLVVTVVWGATFTWMKQALNAADAQLGPRAAVAAIGIYLLLRFGIAAALLAIVPAARRGWNTSAIRGGIALGVVLLVGFLLQMGGLAGISPAVSAFLTSLYVVFTALITAWRGTHRISLPLLVGVVLATFGAGFINGPPHLTFGLAEWLTVACGFVFAIHILITDDVTRRAPILPLTVAAFATVAAGSIVVLIAGLLLPGAPSLNEVIALAGSRAFVVPMLLAATFATVFAITIMNQYQRDLDPVRAAVIYALEPVWAAIIATVLGLGDRGPWLWIGGGALLAGNLVAELGAARARSAASEPSL